MRTYTSAQAALRSARTRDTPGGCPAASTQRHEDRKFYETPAEVRDEQMCERWEYNERHGHWILHPEVELHACQSDQNEFLTGVMRAFRAITGRTASIM